MVAIELSETSVSVLTGIINKALNKEVLILNPLINKDVTVTSR